MATKQDKKIIIIGGGPTGLGAAYRLFKSGYKNWKLYEKDDHFGGLSSTYKDEKGFFWDGGGHVLFSHFPYFDEFVSEVLGKNFYRHQRDTWVKLGKIWIPYPFQNNIRYLSAKDRNNCLACLKKVQGLVRKPKNFKEWVLQTFGKGIADIFMLDYNFNIWAIPLKKMARDWIGERVNVVDFKTVLDNINSKKIDSSWGPNNTFIFPKYRGTGEIFEKGAANIKDNIEIKKEVVSIDINKKIIIFADGQSDSYDYLISAMPINELIKISNNVPNVVRQAAGKLFHNGVFIIGIGLEKKIETSKCWVYFRNIDAPFYRMTYFHHYSPFLVPKADVSKYSSLVCEVSYSEFKKVDKKTIVEKTISALIKNGIIKKGDRKKIISKTILDRPYGYPVPTLDRDKQLRKIQPFLIKNGVYSRGRFGAWKYEVANMDHSFMQGAEAVDKILNNKKETVWSL